MLPGKSYGFWMQLRGFKICFGVLNIRFRCNVVKALLDVPESQNHVR